MARDPLQQGKHSGRRFLWYALVSLLLLLFGSILTGGLFSWLGARLADLLYGTGGIEQETEMREMLAELMLENAMLREDALKSERYRSLLGMTRTSELRALAGSVLYRTEGLVSGNLVIDRGSRDGVVVNSVCVSPEGLLGIVSSCMESQCEVLTLSSPVVQVSCMTYPSGAVGILRRRRSGGLELVNVDISEQVSIGDRVVTSRYGGNYPDGLLVGEVTGVSGGEGGLALSLEVRPAADLSRVTEVLLLLPAER
ncbi:rod shape-determining protein MreC [Candidatus Fermentibacterales bacterium]|nr:rod shape-determining protein MreC [Candidatus Fermentibacterales bacterium]